MLHKTGSNGMRLALACPSTAAAVARVAMPATSGTILPSRRSESTAAGVAGDGASGGGGGTQRKSGLISSLLHGSETIRRDDDARLQQHSKLIARGKYIHQLIQHCVKPDRLEEYEAAAEKYYTGIASDPSLKTKLCGSWSTLIGENDTYIHILEHEASYAGYDEFLVGLRGRQDLTDILNKSLLPTLTSRSTTMVSEFAFWPSSPPRKQGGIFEMRSYQLIPGTLLEWENAWKRGLEARRRFVSPVGAYFSQCGALHQVTHIWQYPDMQTRKSTREKAWSVSGWSDTVKETAKLSQSMRCSILEPLPFSPLQ